MFPHTLLAQQKSGPAPMEVTWPAVTALAAGVVLFGLLMLVTRRYKRCPSNRVLVIYGKTGGGNAAKCVHGGAAFVHQDWVTLRQQL